MQSVQPQLQNNMCIGFNTRVCIVDADLFLVLNGMCVSDGAYVCATNNGGDDQNVVQDSTASEDFI